MSRHEPLAGEFYKHFKGKLYQIVTIAHDASNLDKVVVYQALYAPFRTYVRALNDFMSLVDREKYPESEQDFRFEQVYMTSSEGDHPIVPLKTSITPLEDDPADIDYEKYGEIENQRKEIDGERRVIIEDQVKGALEDHIGDPNPNSVQYVDSLGQTFHGRPMTKEETNEGVDPRLLAFFDARSFTEKLAIYDHMRDGITEKILDDIACVLDIAPAKGSLDERYDHIREDLVTFASFERKR
ncbi:MAG: DUF1653 domain-containing protein [Lachnospiraceae bacterium]|nr:DUF1653 domain-containing protein [Lachnospiraceae bacterium]